MLDLGQPYFAAMPVSGPHGVPRFTQRTIWTHEHGCEISIGRLEMGTHTGTHVDAERHFYPGGRAIDEYPLERFAGPGAVLDVEHDEPGPIGADDLLAAGVPLREGDIVFLRTGFAGRFRDRSYLDHPYLGADAVDLLLERKVRLVGLDTLTPDMPDHRRDADFDYPVHRRLLGAGVLIVENLGAGLDAVRNRRLTLAALPLRIEGGDGAPVAAFALEEGRG